MPLYICSFHCLLTLNLLLLTRMWASSPRHAVCWLNSLFLCLLCQYVSAALSPYLSATCAVVLLFLILIKYSESESFPPQVICRKNSKVIFSIPDSIKTIFFSETVFPSLLWHTSHYDWYLFLTFPFYILIIFPAVTLILEHATCLLSSGDIQDSALLQAQLQYIEFGLPHAQTRFPAAFQEYSDAEFIQFILETRLLTKQVLWLRTQ